MGDAITRDDAALALSSLSGYPREAYAYDDVFHVAEPSPGGATWATVDVLVSSYAKQGARPRGDASSSAELEGDGSGDARLEVWPPLEAGAGEDGTSAATAGSPTGGSGGTHAVLLLGPTPLPPVPEPSDATYFKAHTLAGGVAFELGPALLARFEQTPAAVAEPAAGYWPRSWRSGRQRSPPDRGC